MRKMPEDIRINANALSLRKQLGEDAYSPIDIFSVLSSIDDLTLVYYPLGRRISGMCLRDKDNKIIVINSEHTYGRQRFTAAHELCHIYFHENLRKVVCPAAFDEKDPAEIEANHFASYFLATYESLREFIEKRIQKDECHLSLEDIVRIEQYYGLSRQATLIRLIREGYISEEQAAEMKRGVIKYARELGHDVSLYKPSSEERKAITLGKYVKLAESLREKELISEGLYEQYLLDAFRSDIVYGTAEDEERYD
jgi:Zn-dependent peptidase ImmA (M78 family)